MKLILSLMIALSALYADYSRDYANGIVTDNSTGLIWQDDALGTEINWTAAITQCEGLSLVGHSDWRLPNINELYSIADHSRSDPAIDPTFQNTASRGYWSATTHAVYPASAWVADFYDGDDGAYSKDGSYYVRCVRGGQ